MCFGPIRHYFPAALATWRVRTARCDRGTRTVPHRFLAEQMVSDRRARHRNQPGVRCSSSCVESTHTPGSSLSGQNSTEPNVDVLP